ncbi:lipoprotein-releasing ABC transporter permease subunit [Shewanella yunxiaonensis]|uniref:Lipoprotein-releasing ABC transporter permease subunit n=1 Tax=Shewanella yunxiaonensis TaxID=2829809 RepID=A0ABX7YW66_9GAMM|nr:MULTISPECIES: lipoprotein-releasing ABC transporter permease subunit [Shewanella]MDF0534275.1 lipoprotein-releasing ABC transporter permease subunit [Shewanella sp. A32]QUN07053.1 lipoprotein-releasing ABC transporter permease subunit [Shewanella yunxiaonensis]
MNPVLSCFIGYRYWRARKSNAFASFITFFAVSGIFLGVAALIIVSSVMNGLEGQLKQRILGAVPQLTVHSEHPFSDWQNLAESLKTLPGVRGAAPSIATQAMVQSSENISAVQLYGIIPDADRQLSPIADHTFPEAYNALRSGSYKVLLGGELARRLNVSSGDKVRLLSGDGVVYSPLGPVPSQRTFVVAGVFDMGSQVDANVAYIHYADARRLMRKSPDAIQDLRLFLTDPFAAPQLTPKVEQLLAKQGLNVSASDWRDSYGHLFAAVKMEKNMMSLMLSLIIAVAAFNIVSALVMMVVDKTSDVAVLKTQGLGRVDIMLVFVFQGSLNALLGLVLGLALGITATEYINPLLNSVGISILGPGQLLPVIINHQQLLAIAIGTVVITLLATLYPALRAATVQPANALRYE